MSDRPPPSSPPSRWPYHIAGAIVLAIIVVIGLWTKMGYDGWGKAWVNDFSGDILYEMAWILFFGLIWPRFSSAKLAWGVFLVTCLIEFSQLIPFPPDLKSNLLWRLLMGTTFVWWDFPHYALGSVIGWGILQGLRDRFLYPQPTK